MMDLDPRVLPCLFVRIGSDPILILDRQGEMFTLYDTTDGKTKMATCPEPGIGRAFVFERLGVREQTRTRRTDSWFRDLTTRFRSQLILLTVVGFVATLPGLMAPPFIMLLYDTVISAQSVTLLIELTLAMVVLLAVDLLFRLIRARVMAYNCHTSRAAGCALYFRAPDGAGTHRTQQGSLARAASTCAAIRSLA